MFKVLSLKLTSSEKDRYLYLSMDTFIKKEICRINPEGHVSEKGQCTVVMSWQLFCLPLTILYEVDTVLFYSFLYFKCTVITINASSRILSRRPRDCLHPQ